MPLCSLDTFLLHHFFCNASPVGWSLGGVSWDSRRERCANLLQHDRWQPARWQYGETLFPKKHFRNCSGLWSKPSSDNQLRHQRQHIISTPDQPSYQVFDLLTTKSYISFYFSILKRTNLVFFFGLNKALIPSKYRGNWFCRESMATSEFILHVDRLRGRYTTTTAPIQFKRKKLILWDLHISDFQ